MDMDRRLPHSTFFHGHARYVTPCLVLFHICISDILTVIRTCCYACKCSLWRGDSCEKLPLGDLVYLCYIYARVGGCGSLDRTWYVSIYHLISFLRLRGARLHHSLPIVIFLFKKIFFFVLSPKLRILLVCDGQLLHVHVVCVPYASGSCHAFFNIFECRTKEAYWIDWISRHVDSWTVFQYLLWRSTSLLTTFDWSDIWKGTDRSIF